MERQPDLVGAVFFACGAIFMAALTKWPSLWVTISLNRKETRQHLAKSVVNLRILTTLGALMALWASIDSLLGRS
jgi:hypothetical protein